MIYIRILSDFLFYFFALSLVSSTFSIAVSQISLGVSVLLFLVIYFTKKKFLYFNEMKWFYKFVGLYIAWMIISSLVGTTPLKSLTTLKDEWLFFIIPIGVFLSSKLKIRQNLISLFAYIIIVVSIYGVFQFFTGANWFSHEAAQVAPMYGYRISGFFSYGVTFGNFFSVAGVFLTTYAFFGYNSFTKKKFSLFFLGGVSAILMSILTFSRAPILAIVLATILLFVLLGKTWWKQGLIFTVVLFIFLSLLPGVQQRFVGEFDKEYSGVHKAGRVYIWKNSFKMIADNPIFGVGLGNFKESYAEYIPSDVEEIRKVSSAHNDFIDIAANTGIPGFVFFAALWIAVIYRLWKSYKTDTNLSIEEKAVLIAVLCGSFCFGVISMFHGVFVDDEVRFLLMYLWSLGFAILVSGTLRSKKVEFNNN